MKVIEYKSMVNQDMENVTTVDKFKKRDLGEMILGDKLMLGQGLEEDIKRDIFLRGQDVVDMRMM